MLYPQENEVDRVLMLRCRNCGYEQNAEGHLIFRHDLIHSEGYRHIVMYEVEHSTA